MPRLWYIAAALLGMTMHSAGVVMQKKRNGPVEFQKTQGYKIQS